VGPPGRDIGHSTSGYNRSPPPPQARRGCFFAPPAPRSRPAPRPPFPPPSGETGGKPLLCCLAGIVDRWQDGTGLSPPRFFIPMVPRVSHPSFHLPLHPIVFEGRGGPLERPGFFVLGGNCPPARFKKWWFDPKNPRNRTRPPPARVSPQRPPPLRLPRPPPPLAEGWTVPGRWHGAILAESRIALPLKFFTKNTELGRGRGPPQMWFPIFHSTLGFPTPGPGCGDPGDPPARPPRT